MSSLVHCHLCGYPIALDVDRTHPLGFQWDHVIPRSRGGSNERSNLLPSHAHCNLRKGAALIPSANRIRPLDLHAAARVVAVFYEMPLDPSSVQIDLDALGTLHEDEVYGEIVCAVEDACDDAVEVVRTEFPEVLAAFDEMDLTWRLHQALFNRADEQVTNQVTEALALAERSTASSAG